MQPRLVLPVAMILAGAARLFAAPPPQSGTPTQSAATPPAATQQKALLDKYCVSCHNQKTKTAGLMLDKMDLQRVPQDAEVWEKAIRKLRGGMMPPLGMPRPTPEATEGLASWL